MMSFLRILCLILVIPTAPLLGQGQNSLLWKISGNGISHPSYILGTLKFMGAHEYTLPSVAEKHLREADVFVIEDEVNHHAQHEMNKAIHFEKGKSLADVLSAQDYERLQILFKDSIKIGKCKFRKYARLTPIALSITITRLLLNDKVKYYDIELLKIAKKNDLEVTSLETVEREAQVLNNFPMVIQKDVLLHLMDNLSKQRKDFLMMEKAYVRGNLDQVYKYSLHLFENNKAFMEAFYFRRNREWLPKLKTILASKKAFISTGVLHLKGENGLLSLLRDNGYTVSPVPIN